jgi:putative addiction module component (TIGR02574 family)
MRDEYQRQDFVTLARGKFYAEAAAAKVVRSAVANQFVKETHMTTQEIIAMTLKLKPHERLEVIDKIHESFAQPDPEFDQLWGDEAVRRLEAHRRGELDAVPMEAIFGKR